jgi:nicotinamidase-related amidase
LRGCGDAKTLSHATRHCAPHGAAVDRFHESHGFRRRACDGAARRTSGGAHGGAQGTTAPASCAGDLREHNFGRWESDFAGVVASCRRRGGASAAMADRLAPNADDRSVLKPRHSAFFGTPLEFLLDELGIEALVLAGLAADSCIMFTAHDAYLRKYDLWIPGDCVASERDLYRRQALAHMERVLKARVTPAVA